MIEMYKIEDLEGLLCRRCPKRGATCWYSFWDEGVEPCFAFNIVKELYEYRKWLAKARGEFKGKFAKQHLKRRFNCINDTISSLEKYIKSRRRNI